MSSNSKSDLPQVKKQLASFLGVFTYYEALREADAVNSREQIYNYPWSFYDSTEDFLNEVIRTGILSEMDEQSKSGFYKLIDKFDSLKKLRLKCEKRNEKLPLDSTLDLSSDLF